MSIRPLDMQVMIPKSSQISKQTQQQDQKFNHNQFNVAMEQHKKTELSQQKVIKREDSASISLRKEPQKKNQQQQQEKKNGQKEKKKTLGKYNCFHNGHFDVKV